MQTLRRRFTARLILLPAPLAGALAQPAAPAKPHRVVNQVSDADPAKWALALKKANNIQQDLGADQVVIEIGLRSGHPQYAIERSSNLVTGGCQKLCLSG